MSKRIKNSIPRLENLALGIMVAALCALLAMPPSVRADVISFEGNWGDAGFNLVHQDASGVEIVFSVPTMNVAEVEINGEQMQNVQIPGVFLPNNAGAPNLPGTGRYIALPQGARAELEVVEYRTEVFHNMNIAPAFKIPFENDDSPLKYEKDPNIYNMDAYYPAEPVIIGEPTGIRGVDAVIVGVTPYQYNPVTRDLIVYKDVRVRVHFIGGNGHFGEDRLRSRWWEPALRQNLLNYESLPEVNFHRRSQTDEDNVEYIIIVPDDPSFIAWADTLKRWRNEQGIITGVTTLTEIGGNNYTLIENYIDNAYWNWDIPPVAVLLLSDYQSTGDLYGITAPSYNYGYYSCVSDNFYADRQYNDHLPDINLARITAQDYSDLQTMINKMLDYEREPYTDPGFYQHPLIAGGWQTERWFILACEVVYGYMDVILGKDPVRQYAIYSGYPGSVWSTNPNTWMVVNYFGPSGLGYIPSTPSYLTNWSGNASGINAAINNGAFLVQHRDHGSYNGWGEPSYHNWDLTGLYNDMYTYVFSTNCNTGQFDQGSECFAEAFHRMSHGALGVNAATDVSYSFVNDTFIWGMYDLMWPDFDPYYGADPVGEDNLRPGFANVSGKHYLAASSWPYNISNKDETYYLFHHHGDAFMTLYSEVPQNLVVSHASSVASTATSFTVTADDGSLIGLSQFGEVVGSAEGTGSPISIPISTLTPGTMRVTVTKANYYRYIDDVQVTGTALDVTIDLTYVSGSPVPGSGGPIDYDVSVTNNETFSVTCDAWIDVTVPGVGDINLLNREVTIGAGATISRSLTLNVPGTAPAGTYVMTGNVGAYPSVVWNSSNFSFIKSAAGDGIFDPASFTLTGWDEPWEVVADAPNEFAVLGHFPNPFNPTTTLSYSLPEATNVHLAVYDISGRLVTTLVDGWRDVGVHDVTFDASNLPSGVYLYRLTSNQFEAVGKMVLMK